MGSVLPNDLLSKEQLERYISVLSQFTYVEHWLKYDISNM